MPAPVEPHGEIVKNPRAGRTSPDIADALAVAVQVCFGVVSIAQGVSLGTSGDPTVAPRDRRPRVSAADAADLLVGTAWGAARLSGRLATSGSRVVVPLVGLVARPPLVPRRLQPGHGARRLIERWERDRPETLRSLGGWTATALPWALDAALSQLDVRRLVRIVLDHVDLNAVVADVVKQLDVDAVTLAVLRRADLTSVTTSAITNTDLDRVLDEALRCVDLDTAMANMLTRVDLDRAVATLVERLDLDPLLTAVLARLDLSAAVSSALDQLDLTQLVLDQVDLQRLVAEVVQRLDLTAIVIDQVDLAKVVSAALQRVDLNRIVLEQVDLIGVAEYVVEGIDLPEIIRESTSSVASEAVRVIRLQGAEGDVAIARAVDRLLHRRRHRHVDTIPEQPPTSPDAPEGSTWQGVAMGREESTDE
jgi:uncharacterized protein YjbI with pentapeptide repeats